MTNDNTATACALLSRVAAAANAGDALALGPGAVKNLHLLLVDLLKRVKPDEPTADFQGLLREVLAADDANVDTATTLPYNLTERIRTAVRTGESR